MLDTLLKKSLETSRLVFFLVWSKNIFPLVLWWTSVPESTHVQTQLLVSCLFSLPPFPVCSCSCGARVWEEFGHHLLLVPPDSKHHQLHRRHRWPELEDDPVPAGGLDPGLPGCHQGHSVLWEGGECPWPHHRSLYSNTVKHTGQTVESFKFHL